LLLLLQTHPTLVRYSSDWIKGFAGIRVGVRVGVRVCWDQGWDQGWLELVFVGVRVGWG
jgi:hypothetical protein